MSVETITEIVTANGKSMTSQYNAATRIWLATSAGGRTSELELDARGRIVAERAPKLAESTITYDANGRPDLVSQGARWLDFDYDPSTGFLEKVTDAALQEVIYQRDVVGRVTQVTRPDTEVIGFGYL